LCPLYNNKKRKKEKSYVQLVIGTDFTCYMYIAMHNRKWKLYGIGVHVYGAACTSTIISYCLQLPFLHFKLCVFIPHYTRNNIWVVFWWSAFSMEESRDLSKSTDKHIHIKLYRVYLTIESGSYMGSVYMYTAPPAQAR
jgi:hypothetical protein